MKGRLIWYEHPSDVQLPEEEPNGDVTQYYGGSVTGQLKHFDSIQSTLSLQSALHEYHVGINTDHLEMAMDKIKVINIFMHVH